MARMEKIALADIRPDANNPREDFGDLDALAASFDVTPDRPGEPITPPIVVRDGNVYRIVDGERRYRAMIAAGKVDGCLCMVFDDMSEAASVVAMMATDNKEALSDEEKSRGVQMMLIFGIGEQEVSRAAAIDADDVRKVRRSLGKREKPMQLTLNEMYSLAEIEDDAKRAELAAMSDDAKQRSAFSKALGSEIARQGRQRQYDAYRAALLEHVFEIDIVDKMPKGYKTVLWIRSLNEVESCLDKVDDSCLVHWKILLAPPKQSEWGSYWNLDYPKIVAEAEEVDAYNGKDADDEYAELENDISNMAEVAQENMLLWIAGAFRSEDGRPSAMEDAEGHPELDPLRELVWDMFLHRYGSNGAVWHELGLEASRAFPAMILYSLGDFTADLVGYAGFLSGRYDSTSGWYERRVRDALEFSDLLISCGYRPDDTERDLIMIARKRLKEACDGEE